MLKTRNMKKTSKLIFPLVLLGFLKSLSSLAQTQAPQSARNQGTRNQNAQVTAQNCHNLSLSEDVMASLPPILDQGDTNLCWSFVASELLSVELRQPVSPFITALRGYQFLTDWAWHSRERASFAAQMPLRLWELYQHRFLDANRSITKPIPEIATAMTRHTQNNLRARLQLPPGWVLDGILGAAAFYACAFDPIIDQPNYPDLSLENPIDFLKLEFGGRSGRDLARFIVGVRTMDGREETKETAVCTTDNSVAKLVLTTRLTLSQIDEIVAKSPELPHKSFEPSPSNGSARWNAITRALESTCQRLPPLEDPSAFAWRQSLWSRARVSDFRNTTMRERRNQRLVSKSVDEGLALNRPVAISFEFAGLRTATPQEISRRTDTARFHHAGTVIGREWVADPRNPQGGRCEYLVRSTLGESRGPDQNCYLGPRRKCEKGIFRLTRAELDTLTGETLYITPPQTQ
jgi:hypothetical protein